MEFEVLSRSNAKRLSYKPNIKDCIIISITDLGSNPNQFAANPHIKDVLKLQFDDVDYSDDNCITQEDGKKIIDFVNNKKRILYTVLVLIAISSQNIIPIHIAFIPILIPPLLHTMNVMKVDRRVISCLLAFGLKTPYIVLPVGFGLIFQNLIAENMIQNGMLMSKSDVWKYTWILGIGMLIALLIAIFISYRKPREYKDLNVTKENFENQKLNYKHYITILAAIVTFGVQILTHSLPLGALCGLGIIFSLGAVKHSKMDKLMDEGIYMMGYVAFIMCE